MTAPAAFAQTENDSAIWPFSHFHKDKTKEESVASPVVNVPPRPLISGPEDMAAIARGTPPAPYVPTEEIIPAAPADTAPRPSAAPPQGKVATGVTLAAPSAPPEPDSPQPPAAPKAPAAQPVTSPAISAPLPTSKPMGDVPATPDAPTAAVVPVVAPTEMPLATGEKLMLTVENDQSLSGPITVNAVGEVVLPLAGPIKIGGLTLAEAQTRIVSAYANGYFIKPKVILARAR